MSDEPQRHRIQVACPECGHRQSEPALVISTQCRICLHHYQVRDGLGVARSRSEARIAKLSADVSTESAPPPAAPKPEYSLSKPLPPPKPLLLRLLTRSQPPRDVVCFRCSHSFHAIAQAQSSQCPKCGEYVSLVDYDIDDIWNRRIQTRGNITIRKNAAISDASVSCHHLTVLGRLHGDADCSGDLVIRSSGRVTGTIHCHTLHVEKSSRVEFMQPVHTHSAVFHGQVLGQIFCTGPVVLEKYSRFQGLIRTPSLVAKRGSEQSGTVEIIASPSPQPSTP
jgi:cytoskeletal protein CcmA (bactofilin family)/DNA-directed RNA polymerase subunit RPC12/RpoP